jgi:hypothetical protein
MEARRMKGIVLVVVLIAAGCGKGKTEQAASGKAADSVAAPVAVVPTSSKVLAEADFKAVSDAVHEKAYRGKDKIEARKEYTLAHLGTPHRTEGTKLSWYSSPSCNFYEFDTTDGGASWGSALNDVCAKYAVK